MSKFLQSFEMQVTTLNIKQMLATHAQGALLPTGSEIIYTETISNFVM